jgi:hypothetical protein
MDFAKLNKWFNGANLLNLTYKTTQCIQFTTKNNFVNNITIGFNNKRISNITTRNKLLGKIIVKSTSWKVVCGMLCHQSNKNIYVRR